MPVDVTSIFLFSGNVFKSIFSKGLKQSRLCGKLSTLLPQRTAFNKLEKEGLSKLGQGENAVETWTFCNISIV